MNKTDEIVHENFINSSKQLLHMTLNREIYNQ